MSVRAICRLRTSEGRVLVRTLAGIQGILPLCTPPFLRIPTVYTLKNHCRSILDFSRRTR